MGRVDVDWASAGTSPNNPTNIVAITQITVKDARPHVPGAVLTAPPILATRTASMAATAAKSLPVIPRFCSKVNRSLIYLSFRDPAEDSASGPRSVWGAGKEAVTRRHLLDGEPFAAALVLLWASARAMRGVDLLPHRPRRGSGKLRQGHRPFPRVIVGFAATLPPVTRTRAPGRHRQLRLEDPGDLEAVLVAVGAADATNRATSSIPTFSQPTPTRAWNSNHSFKLVA